MSAELIERTWNSSESRRRIEAIDQVTDPHEAHDLARAVIVVYEQMITANRTPTYDTFRLVAEADEDELFEEEIVDLLPKWAIDIVQGYPEDEPSPIAEFFLRILVVEIVALRTRLKATLLLEQATGQRFTAPADFLAVVRTNGSSSSRAQKVFPDEAAALAWIRERAAEHGATHCWLYGPQPDGDVAAARPAQLVGHPIADLPAADPNPHLWEPVGHPQPTSLVCSRCNARRKVTHDPDATTHCPPAVAP